MSEFSSYAILLKKVDYSEKDKIVLLFTKKKSKISAIGIGAKKSKKRKLNLLDYWYLLDIKFSKRKNYPLYIIDKVEIVEDLTPNNYNFNHLTFLLVCNEIISAFLYGEEDAKELFNFYVEFLKIMKEANTKINFRNFLNIFKISVLEKIGLRLNFEKCIICGKDGIFQNYSIEKCGFVCNNCSKNSIKISKGTLKTIDYIHRGKLNLKIDRSISEEINKIFSINLYHMRGEGYLKHINSVEKLLNGI